MHAIAVTKPDNAVTIHTDTNNDRARGRAPYIIASCAIVTQTSNKTPKKKYKKFKKTIDQISQTKITPINTITQQSINQSIRTYGLGLVGQ